MPHTVGVLELNPKCLVKYDEVYLEEYEGSISRIYFMNILEIQVMHVPMGGDSQGVKLGQRDNFKYGLSTRYFSPDSRLLPTPGKTVYKDRGVSSENLKYQKTNVKMFLCFRLQTVMLLG